MKNDEHRRRRHLPWSSLCFLIALSCGCDSPTAGTSKQVTEPVQPAANIPAPVAQATNKSAPKPKPAKIEPVSFYADVSPILDEYCVDCHGADEPEAQLELTTVSSVLSGGDGGPAVEPGKPDSSLLWEMVSEEHMPPKGPRPSREERELIRLWIAGGAKD